MHPRIRSLFALVLSLVTLVALASCGGSRKPLSRTLPAPEQNTQVGSGDAIEVSVDGEQALSKEYEIYPDGNIDFPHIGRIRVAEQEPQDIADLIKGKLKEAKYLIDPQVSVKVKTYRSKQMRVIGAVTKPGNVPWSPRLRLVDALSLAGWFTPLADTDHVVVTRKSGDRTVQAEFNVSSITREGHEDVLLQAGDTILVEQKIF